MTHNPTHSPHWQKLAIFAKDLNIEQDITGLPELSEVIGACDIAADFSRHLVSDEILDTLISLLESQDFAARRDAYFTGGHLNFTEDRAVLHTAIRAPEDADILIDGEPVMLDVIKQRHRVYDFADRVRSGSWQGATGKHITDIVHIGIGGSVLGLEFASAALKDFIDGPQIHFVANVDGTDLYDVMQKCAPETTLFYIASKSFTTTETMTNAQTARQWIIDALGKDAVAQHFAAASTARDKVEAFGINPEATFGFWDWVGGRFSSWSAISLPLAVAMGRDNHQAWLDGAHQMDLHFYNNEMHDNVPVLMALLGVWYRNFLKIPIYTVSPYATRLANLPRYIQQIDMESNGKRIDRDGHVIDYDTGPYIFGEAGTNAQHSYFQLLHQGTTPSPVDFILVNQPISDAMPAAHQQQLLANGRAQPDALWQGRDLASSGNDPHKTFPGKRPSTLITLPEISPAHIGALMACYEHKVFTQGVIWNINSFDQFGVELGKEMARTRLGK